MENVYIPPLGVCQIPDCKGVVEHNFICDVCGKDYLNWEHDEEL